MVKLQNYACEQKARSLKHTQKTFNSQQKKLNPETSDTCKGQQMSQGPQLTKQGKTGVLMCDHLPKIGILQQPSPSPGEST